MEFQNKLGSKHATEPTDFDDKYDCYIHTFNYFNTFSDKIFSAKSPEYLYKKVLNEMDRQNSIDEISSTHKLAGDIAKETDFILDKCDVELGNELMNFLNNQMLILKSQFEEFQQMKGWKIISIWTNYQKAGEYNPVHTHEGDLSFVWYLDIPEEIRLEHLNQKETTTESRGLIEIYSQRTGDARLFNPKSGDFLLFQASQPHQVYPFYTKDVTRISMSGNIGINFGTNGE